MCNINDRFMLLIIEGNNQSCGQGYMWKDCTIVINCIIQFIKWG